MQNWSWGLVRADGVQTHGSPFPDESHDHQTVLEGVEEPAEFSYSATKSARPETERRRASAAWLFKDKNLVGEGICAFCAEEQLNKIKT